MPRVSIIVVSYQVCDLLLACLATARAQAGIGVEILVVDNASTDGSADAVARDFPDVQLIRNATNVGFARANNQALGRATGEYLALINPDCELPVDALAAAIAVFARHPNAGAVGLALDRTDRSPQPACHSFPGVFNLAFETAGLHRPLLQIGIGTPTAAPIPRGDEGSVDWVAGACMVLSRDAYHSVGGLNEELFLFGEEMDWSWRARARGFSTIFSSSARVIHHGGTSGTGQRGPLFVRNVEARLAFLRRYRGAWRAALARELIVIGAGLRLCWWTARRWFESPHAPGHAYTLDQIERFRAVLTWRWRGSA